ncbi:MAG: hypothetical protein HRT68_00675 [Flavobacteriaceae bacterium]|nr:hypothetical protein [Flavobacteriaceae bacterium]
MKAYCTYCSAEKNDSEKAIPAIDLYNSHRISEVYKWSQEKGLGFLILSGKYGLVEPTERIHYYDHLLKPKEVEPHSDLLASQIKAMGITEIVFFMSRLEKDPNLQAYRDCITKACIKSNVALTINVIDFQD